MYQSTALVHRAVPWCCAHLHFCAHTTASNCVDVSVSGSRRADIRDSGWTVSSCSQLSMLRALRMVYAVRTSDSEWACFAFRMVDVVRTPDTVGGPRRLASQR